MILDPNPFQPKSNHTSIEWNRIPIAGGQIESYARIESQTCENRDLNQIVIWICPALVVRWVTTLIHAAKPSHYVIIYSCQLSLAISHVTRHWS